MAPLPASPTLTNFTHSSFNFPLSSDACHAGYQRLHSFWHFQRSWFLVLAKKSFQKPSAPAPHPQNRNLVNPVESSVVLFPKYPKAYNFSATRFLNISSVITLKNTRTHYKAETYLCQQNPSQSISNGSIYTNHVKLHFCLAQADNVNSKFLQCIKIMEQKKISIAIKKLNVQFWACKKRVRLLLRIFLGSTCRHNQCNFRGNLCCASEKETSLVRYCMKNVIVNY